MKSFMLALRTLKNYPLYSTVNILGLALSIACVVVIARYINGELNVDRGHAKIDNICVSFIENNVGTEYMLCPLDFGDSLRLLTDAAVLKKTKVYREKVSILIDGQRTTHTAVNLRVDSVFQQILDFPVVSGNPKICAVKNEAAITVDFAKKLFGSDDPIGKKITANYTELIITSVVESIKTKSSLTFDLLLNDNYCDNWNGSSTSFVLLAPGHTATELNERYGDYSDIWGSNNGTLARFQLAQLGDIYFNSAVDEDNLFAHNEKRTIMVLFIVALAVLVIGVFNFVNIYTVLMLRRSREVGLKSVFGAPAAVIAQGLYVENLVMVLCSVAIGWILAQSFEPLIVERLGIDAPQNLPFDIWLSVGLIVLIPFITSLYPYIKYRYQKPISTIQGVNAAKGSPLSRSIFLVAQYFITIVIVIVALFFTRQLNFMLNADLGYKYDNVIKLKLFEEPRWLGRQACDEFYKQVPSKAQVVEQQISQSGLFINWNYCSTPNDDWMWNLGFSCNGGAKVPVQITQCSAGFFKMFGIDILWGREWSDSTDTWRSYNMIVNEAFLKVFDIKEPATAVIQPETRLWTMTNGDPVNDAEMKTNPAYKIVGVCRDYQFGHLSQSVKPTIFTCSDGFWGSKATNMVNSDFCARILPGKEGEAIKLLEKLYNEIGGTNFQYSMVEDEIEAQYADDKKISIIYSLFSIIAIVISCMGLFSLSLYDVQRRRGEITLRRVNGASVKQITLMLLQKYYLLLTIAVVIAFPMATFGINWYVADFAHRAPLSWWIFAIAIVITAAISLFTLIFQIRKAANTNPVEAIKLS